jgi:hypothetical protein
MLKNQLALAAMIKDRIFSWSITEKGIRLIPRRSLMHVICLDLLPGDQAKLEFTGYLQLSDFTEIWSAILENAIRGAEFSLSQVFRDLMSCETSLRRKGFFQKTMVFVETPRLQQLGKETSSFTPQSKLRDLLNQDTILLTTIEGVQLRTLEVELTSELLPLGRQKNMMSLREEVRDPKDVIWRLRGMIAQHNEEKIATLFEIMEKIAEKVVQVSRERVQGLGPSQN